MHLPPGAGIVEALNNRRCLEMEKEEEKKIKKVKEKYTDFFDDDTDSHSKIGDFFYNNIGVIAALSTFVVITSSVVGYIFAEERDRPYYEYRDHLDDYKVVCNDTDYSIHDVYVVYNTDNVWFCTRKLAKIIVAEKEVVQRYGYHYRYLIYDYYDLQTGKKICQDHEENFNIESIDSLYTYDDVKEHNGNISYEELVSEQTLDNLLSRDPELRPKR